MPEQTKFAERVPRSAPESLALTESLIAKGEFEQAQACFLQALQTDPGCETRNAFGCFLWKTGRYSAAASEFSQVMSQAEEERDFAHLSAAASNLAAVYREWGEPENASYFQQYALNLEARLTAEMSLESPRQNLPLGNLANDAILAGDYTRAESLLWRSLLQEWGEGTADGEAGDWGSLGVVAGLRGEVRTAMDYFGRALKLHLELADHRGIGSDFLHLGQLVAQTERWPLAARILRQAVRHLTRARLFELADKARRMLLEVETAIAMQAEQAKINPLLN